MEADKNCFVTGDVDVLRSPRGFPFLRDRGENGARFHFFCRVPKSGCVSVMFRGALMRVARAARGASLCQEKPGMQPDEDAEIEEVAFCYHCALTEDVSVKGCMRASGSKVAKANAADDLTTEAAPSMPLCLRPPARRHGGAP